MNAYRTTPEVSQETVPSWARLYEADLCDIEVEFQVAMDRHPSVMVFRGDDPHAWANKQPRDHGDKRVMVLRGDPGAYLRTGDEKLLTFLRESQKQGFIILGPDYVVNWSCLRCARVTKRTPERVQLLWRSFRSDDYAP
jgi:hypothetical protein